MGIMVSGMAGKAVKSFANAVGDHQFPWIGKFAQYSDVISKGDWGNWEVKAWERLAGSARRQARIRKEASPRRRRWEGKTKKEGDVAKKA